MVRVKVVTVMKRQEQDEVNQEDSKQNEVDGMKKGADSTGKVMPGSLDYCLQCSHRLQLQTTYT